MIGQTLDRFRVLSQLGEGGMGAVYEAIDDQSGKRVAIKVLHKEHASNQQIALRFINEARAINVVDHPGIVQVANIGQLPDGTAYIVMELLTGETLSARMKRAPGGRMPVLDCLRLGKQIASALAAAHAKTIVHREAYIKNTICFQVTH
jgi:serine/threonine protein kinase